MYVRCGAGHWVKLLTLGSSEGGSPAPRVGTSRDGSHRSPSTHARWLFLAVVDRVLGEGAELKIPGWFPHTFSRMLMTFVLQKKKEARWQK